MRKISEGPDRQKHQPDKEKRGEHQDAIDHLPLRNQVHEITGYQESLAAGNEQRHADIDRPIAKGNIGRPYSDQGAKEQRIKNEKITPHMMAEMLITVRGCDGGGGRARRRISMGLSI